MVAVAQLVESRIVIPVVVGSSPISHPIISFQKTFNPICLNPVEITLSSYVLMVAGKMSLMGLKGGISAGTGGVCGLMAMSRPALQIRRLLRLEKTTKNRRLCSMTSKVACSISATRTNRPGGFKQTRTATWTLQQTVILSGPNDGGTGPLIACSRRL